MEILVKFTLRLNVDKWGTFNKGDVHIFYIPVFDERNGLVRHPIDKRWDIISKEIIEEDDIINT